MTPVVERRRGRRRLALTPMQPFSFRIDDALLAEMCREARRQRVDVAVIIRVAAKRFMALPERARGVRATDSDAL